MSMNKYEKDILKNKNLEAPDESVLSKAKSALPQEKHRKRLNYKQVLAIVSSCVVVLLVLACIPAMIPAQSAEPIVMNSQLQCESIESIESYNINSSENILNFGISDETKKYTYNNEILFLEEYSTIGSTKIKMLVKFNSNAKYSRYEKQNEYTELLFNTNQYSVSDILITWANNENTIILTFSSGEYTYYLKITEDISDWQNLLEEFLF